MKYIFLILLFCSQLAFGQYKALSFNKTVIRYDTTIVNEVPESTAGYSWNLLKLKSTGDTLAVFFENGNVLLFSTPTASNISTIGTSTAVMITIPTVASSDRYLINNQVAYKWTKTSHIVNGLFDDSDRKRIYRTSDGRQVATFFGDGCVWDVMPSNPTLIAQGIILISIP